MIDSPDFDVLIVGGGLVGSALAVALGGLGLRTALVEARDPATLEQPSFDGRATALANGSQRILAQLGLWPAIEAEAQPIRSIHIGERGRFGAARIEARDEGVAALGFTVENRVLGRALWERLARIGTAFESLAPATLLGFETGAAGVTARIDLGGASVTARARLIVAADGAASSVRAALGIAARADDYAQGAIIVNCTTEFAHAGCAYERFTARGPIAVLPLTRGRVAVVWTLPAATAEHCMGLGPDEFRRELQAAFGHRLGRFGRIGERTLHPLRRTLSAALLGRRALLIGNAAVSLHPVAGQGFNLALRDAAALAELIADERGRAGPAADIGNPELLERYAAWRRSDQRKVAAFTHGLVRVFGMAVPGLGVLRGLGLVAFDLIPGAKSALARHTMGMAGRVPRLARGLDLA